MGKHVEEHVHLEVDSDEFAVDKPELITMLKKAFEEQGIDFEITNEMEVVETSNDVFTTDSSEDTREDTE